MKCRFGDIASFRYGKLPLKNKISNNGKYPIFSGYRTVGFYDEYNISENQLVIVVRGVGGTGDVKLTKEKCYLTNLAVAVDFITDDIFVKYIYYYFLINNLRYLDSGSAQSQITISDLKNVEIDLPDLRTQKKIAKILSALDDKIECNNQINKNLEDQVSAIYSSWFENFDLYNGECPENWFLGKLSDIAEISSGKRPLIKTNICDSEFCIPIVGAASVMGFTNKANYSERILVTGRVGTHGVIQRFNSQCWASDNTLVIKSRYYEFTNQILKRIDYTSMNRGSTQPLITQGDLNKVKILLPDKDMLDKFEYVAGGLMNQYERNVNENIKLSELRDTLLPKLMSGELDVSDIDI